MKKTLLIVVALLCLCMLAACGSSVAKNEAIANDGATADAHVGANDSSRQHGTYQLLISESGDENAPATTSTVTILLGDVNGDGKITNADILMMYKYLFNSTLNPLPTITQKDHTLIVHEAKAPTCTEPGWEKYVSCSCCDQSTYVEIAPTGHSEVYHAAKAPTYTEIGWEAYVTCENCDYSTYVEIPMLPAYTEGLQFTLNPDNSSYSVSGYTGTATDVVIPTVYDGKPVTIIAKQAFRHSDITSIVIPDSIVAIEYEAFYYCSNLSSITIEYGIASIGDWAFSGCISLNSIEIPDSVTSLGGSVFNGCTSLRNVVLSNRITSISNTLFHDCRNLESIVIPDGVTSIGLYVFNGCTSLESIVIPDSVTTIGDRSFYDCGKLKTVYYGGTTAAWRAITIYPNNEALTSATIICDNGNQPFYTEGLEFTLNSDNASYSVSKYSGTAADVVIPETYEGLPVTSIADYAIYRCAHLKSITIPNSVISMTVYSFYDCESLENIIVADDNQNYSSLDGNLFNKEQTRLVRYAMGKTATEYTVPNGVEVIDGSAFLNCTNLESVIIPEGVIFIGDRAFENCINLKNVYIPASVIYIGENAFACCTSLENIIVADDNQKFSSVDGSLFDKDKTAILQYAIGKADPWYSIPEGVTIVTNFAFYWCESIQSIVVPDSVTYIGDYAFAYCTSLDTITISNSVTYIGDYAFEGCTSLKTVYYIGEDWEWEQIAIGQENDSLFTAEKIFAMSTKGLEFTLNDDGTEYIVSGYTGTDTKVHIPTVHNKLPVTAIDSWAFEYSSIETIVIPDSIVNIGYAAFRYCKNLVNIVVDDNNPEYCSVDGNLYSKGMGKLIQYAIGSEKAEFIIPDGVVSIEEEAFSNAVNLHSIIIPDSVEYIGSKAFDSCTSLIYARVGSGVKELGSWAFGHCTSLESVDLSDGITSIGFAAFGECAGLVSITIPDSVTSISESAFYGCTKLETVIYAGTKAQWNNITILAGNDPLINATIVYNNGDQPYYTDGLKFTLNPDNESYSVSGYNGMDVWVTIPETFDGLPVTVISHWAFESCNHILGVFIPNTVTTIEDDAFIFFWSLTEVVIPDSVTYIGVGAFAGCTSLADIIVDENNLVYSTLDGNLFNKDQTILIQYMAGKIATEYTVPDFVTCIEPFAFYESVLEHIVIPESIMFIGADTFYSCMKLKSITIPRSVTFIGDSAFGWCSSLETIYYNGTEEEWENIEIGCNNEYLLNAQFVSTYYTEGLEFAINGSETEYRVSQYNGTDTHVIIPAVYNGLPVTSIDDYAFQHRNHIGYVSIPDSVISIGSYAFSYCMGLESITIGSGVKTIGEYAFQAVDYIINVYYTGDVEGWLGITFADTYSNPMSSYYTTRLYFGGELVTDVIIPDSITEISDYAFRGCSSIKNVTIHDGVTSIGFRAFHNCQSLESVTIGNGVTSIGVMAFAKCEKLKTVNMGNSVKTIGQSAFESCTSLESLVLPKSVTKIGDTMILNCVKLQKIYYTGTEAEWNAISIGFVNSELYSVTKVYNYAQ